MDAAKIAGALKTLVELAENSKVAQQFKRVVIVSTVVAGALLWGMQARPELADKYKAFKRASENQEVVEWIFLGCVILVAIMLMSWGSAKWDARGKKKAEEAAKKKVYDKLVMLEPELKAAILYLVQQRGSVQVSSHSAGALYARVLQEHGIANCYNQRWAFHIHLELKYMKAVKEDVSCVSNLKEVGRTAYLRHLSEAMNGPPVNFEDEYEFVETCFGPTELEDLFIDPAKVPENLWGEEVTDVG